MRKQLRCIVFRRGEWLVAQLLEYDIATQARDRNPLFHVSGAAAPVSSPDRYACVGHGASSLGADPLRFRRPSSSAVGARSGTLTAVFTTIEAEVDEKGNIRPKEPVTLPPGSRVLVTVLEAEGSDTALLSQAALSVDWDRPEEEAAWSQLSQG